MLIRQHGCASWSAPLLLAYCINRFSHDVTHWSQAKSQNRHPDSSSSVINLCYFFAETVEIQLHLVQTLIRVGYNNILKLLLIQISEKTPLKLKVTPPKKSSCLYVCQHCLVHLGDIGKNKNLLNWAAQWQNQQCGCAPSDDSDQPDLCAQWVAKNPSFLHTDSEDSDQGRMPSWSESSLGAQPHCWFFHEVAQLMNR